MYPILFKIGPLEVGTFGVMLVLAFLTSGWVARRELERHGFDGEWAWNMLFAAALAGIVGARTYFIFEHWSEFLQDPLGLLLSRGGLTWYGGFIAGIAAVVWVIHKLPAPSLKIADLVAPVILLGYAIGRIGCLLAGDGDYGPPADVPWAMAFPHGIVPTTVPVHPTPLYETLMSLLLFWVLWKLRTRPHLPGTMVSYMMIAYGIERFVAEFWRTTPKILFGWMSMAQILSVLFILAGLTWLMRLRQRARAESIASSG